MSLDTNESTKKVDFIMKFMEDQKKRSFLQFFVSCPDPFYQNYSDMTHWGKGYFLGKKILYLYEFQKGIG